MIWDYYATHPARAKRFANAMKTFASTDHELSLSFLATGYPWSSLRAGSTVVDCGGSEGHASITIAKAHPDLSFVVQDLPEVVKKASFEAEVPEHVAKRISFVGHDLLTPQEVQGDVYLFRWIFHDWPDTYVIKMLRNLIPALRAGAKIVVSEQLMPAPGTVPLVTERGIRLVYESSLHVGNLAKLERFFDMTMLSFHNSREREKGDWEVLFHEADEKFREVRVWTAEDSLFALIDAVWMP